MRRLILFAFLFLLALPLRAANNQLLASDNFASGSMAAGWSAISSLGPLKSVVVSGSPNVSEGGLVLNTWGAQYWSGLTWPSDQISEVSVNLTSEPGTHLQLIDRWTDAAGTGYLAEITNGTILMYRIDPGLSIVQLGSTVTGLTFAPADVWALSMAGSSITIYQNNARVFVFYDSTYSSGSPGYRQNSNNVSESHSQVLSWRGYSAIQQDGIWQKQGVVIPAIATDLSGSPAGQGVQTSTSILHEGNAQLLSGTVYKAWLTSRPASGNGVYYAESTDLKTWTRASSAAIAGYMNATVFKNGSTYYLYAQADGASGSGNIAVFTGALGGGSPGSDGITWTLQSPSQVIGLGTSGTWDAASVYGIQVTAIIAGTWYGLYAGTSAANATAGLYSTGLVTSTDGINWVKSGSNPVLANTLPFCVTPVGSTYYMWAATNQPGRGNSLVPDLDPTEIVRYQTTDFINWTNPTHSVHNTQMFESLNATTGQVFASYITDIGGVANFLMDVGVGDAVNPVVAQVELAIGPASIAQIVTTNEDAAAQIAADAFTSGAGNLSSNWVTPTGSTKLQIVSGNLVEATATSTSSTMAYTGAAFSANQYSEITITTLGSASYAGPAVRTQTGANSEYIISNSGPTGTADTFFQIATIVAGVTHLIGPAAQVTSQIGDKFRLQVTTGSDGFPILSAFQNGFLILQVEDYNNYLTSGYPGMNIYTPTLANVQISSWAGGNANVIPTYPSSASNALWFGLP
jgi:hypothetical protein